jgi:hypothetical protein
VGRKTENNQSSTEIYRNEMKPKKTKPSKTKPNARVLIPLVLCSPKYFAFWTMVSFYTLLTSLFCIVTTVIPEQCNNLTIFFKEAYFAGIF